MPTNPVMFIACWDDRGCGAANVAGVDVTELIGFLWGVEKLLRIFARLEAGAGAGAA